MATTMQLVRNAERALGMRKQAAELTPLLNANVTTPSHLLEEQWDLYGDGRHLVASKERTLLMLAALNECAREYGSSSDQVFPLNVTVGTAKLLGELVARYAGVKAFDEGVEAALSNPEGWPLGQISALKVIERYREHCANRGIIEPGSAARELLHRTGALALTSEEPLFLAPAQEAWLAAQGTAGVNQAKEAEGSRVLPLAEGVEARFTILAGSTVIVRAVEEEIQAVVKHWEQCERTSEDPCHIVAFAPDPVSLYDALGPYLASIGVRTACKASMPFTDTILGSTLHAVRQMRLGNADWKDQATDFAYSPFSGLGRKEAQRLNTQMRKDSLLDESSLEERLKDESTTFSTFIQVLNRFDSESVQALQKAIEEHGLMPSSRRIVEAAAFHELDSLAATVLDAAHQSYAVEMLESLKVPYAQQAAPLKDSRAWVEFRSMEAMDAFAEGSVDAVIFADMTKGAFPVSSARPATDEILMGLGLEDARQRHDELRAAFAVAERAASMSVTCIVPLRNLAGDLNYPSFIYDEFVEALSHGDAVTVDADGLFKVPAFAWKTPHRLDESDVVQGFGQAFSAVEETVELPQRTEGVLHTLTMRDFMKMSETKAGHPVLSASQIERYLQCPYGWFISRKIGVHGIDESMDARRLGSFTHEVFRRTFEALADQGIKSITEANVDIAREVATQAFDELKEEERALDPNQSFEKEPEEHPDESKEDQRRKRHDRCVAATARDEIVLQETREQVLQAFGFMPLMPQGFEIRAGELKLDPEAAIEYAGAIIDGSVDRIDVAEDGRFAILDYKGSVSAYQTGCEADTLEALPAKVQALIYASCVQRVPAYAPMTCVGAMYLGYRAKKAEEFSAGSYDVGAYDMRAVTQEGTSSVSMSFTEYLNRVERLIAPSVARMLAGDIAPAPQEGACTYCELKFCDARMAN